MKKLLYVCALLTAAATSTHAETLTWTLHDVTLSNGTELSGNFRYNAASNLYESAHISLASWDAGQIGDIVFYYVPPVLENPGFQGDNYNLQLLGEETSSICCTDDALLNLGFNEALALSGPATIAVSGLVTYHYDTPDPITASITGGYITAVPVPAALWLFGSALASLGWLRRNKAG